MEVLEYFQYNSIVILSYFFLSFFAYLLNVITKGKSNKLFFSSMRGNPFNPMTYIRMITHAIGHASWDHFMHNFLLILLIGPMIEEKYGSIELLIMLVINAFITGLLNAIFCKNTRIRGASGSAFMLIVLSSFVNYDSGKIPLTFVLICLFYIVGEIRDGLVKKDNISHMGHLIGAISGFVFGFFIFK